MSTVSAAVGRGFSHAGSPVHRIRLTATSAQRFAAAALSAMRACAAQLRRLLLQHWQQHWQEPETGFTPFLVS